jgi:acyl-CoA synthetase (AMP-forming)/AMP-acid ligase II
MAPKVGLSAFRGGREGRDADEAELPPGQVGEIIVHGENVMQGYLNNEAATKDTINNGWLFTGDLGYLDDDGYIFIVDRKKDLIISHGLNIAARGGGNLPPPGSQAGRDWRG